MKATTVLVALTLAAGCDPMDVPRLSPDGKSVAFILRSESEEEDKDSESLWILPLKTRKQRRVDLPEGWIPDGFIWFGEKLLIEAKRPMKKPVTSGAKKGKEYDLSFWLFDPGAGKSTKTGIEPHMAISPFVGTHKRRTCLYAPVMDAERTRILSLDDLSKLGSLRYEAEGVGDGWMIREVRGKVTSELIKGKHAGWIRDSLPKDQRTVTRKEMTAVVVYNDKRKKMTTITRGEIAKACWRDARSPKCGRVSSNHKQILLGFDTETIFRQHSHEYTFGVFDIRTGKHLWGGSSNNLQGLPAFVGESVYALETASRRIYTGERTPAAMFAPSAPRSQPTGNTVLARHTKEGRKVIVELSLGKGSKASRYSASPDRRTFVLQVEGDNPRLMLIPIRDKVERKDVIEIPIDVPDPEGEKSRPSAVPSSR